MILIVADSKFQNVLSPTLLLLLLLFNSPSTAMASVKPAMSISQVDWRRVDQAVMPTVVRVLKQDGDIDGSGSGFVIAKDGYILTNAHVINGAQHVKIMFERGESFDGEVINSDDWVDLALVRIYPKKDLPFLKLTTTASLVRGEPVAAFGSPLSFPFSLTTGVISGLSRTYSEQDAVSYLQHDAAINPGSSGGPVVDVHGRVLGINTATPEEAKFNIGISLAIPSETIQLYWRRYQRKGQVIHAALGARVRGLTPALAQSLGATERRGLVIEEVSSLGPASAAGLQVGDLVLAVDGHHLDRPSELGAIIWRHDPGDVVRLDLRRADRTMFVEIKLGQGGETPSQPFTGQLTKEVAEEAERNFGLTVKFRPTGNSGGAVEVADVKSNSPALSAGLIPGDQILSINGHLVEDSNVVAQLLADKQTQSLLMLVSRPLIGQQFILMEKLPSSAAVTTGAVF